MKKIVVLGGGSGSFTVLSGLKRHDVELSAIVSMADDGGSTGVLRDELGVLPPGDVRQCIVALSDSSRLMRSLMNYRFEDGGLKGHSFGNLLLCAMEKVTGSFEKATEEVGKILNIKGKVIPVTSTDVRLKMELSDGTMLKGEGEIYTSDKISQGYKRMFLEPTPIADVHAIAEIMNADLIVFGPGGLYSSLIPLLLVPGIAGALRETKAHKAFILNLMNRKGQTGGFTANSYLHEIQKFTGFNVFDTIIINDAKVSDDLLEKYKTEGTLIYDDLPDNPSVKRVDVVSSVASNYEKTDVLAKHRVFIRHDSEKIAKELMSLVNNI